MKTTAMFLAAAIALGVAGQASAQVVRDHRRAARTPAPRVDRNVRRPRTPARDYRDYRYGSNGGYYYHNGLWQYDTPVGQPIRDPMWFRYPGVAAPSGPIHITYDASGGYMWIAGYWEWYRGQWMWIDGYWEPARTGYYYEPGYWNWHGSRWNRTAGHWRRLPSDQRGIRIRRSDTRINERVPARRGTSFRRH